MSNTDNKNFRRTIMIDLAECFVDAYKHHLDQLEPDTQLMVKRFSTIVALEQPASFLFSKEYVPELVAQVFRVAEIRQFIIDLTAGWIMRMGIEESQMTDISRTLANAFSLHSENANDCVIPSTILATSSNIKDLIVLFRDNKWLITIALIKMFTTVNARELSRN